MHRPLLVAACAALLASGAAAQINTERLRKAPGDGLALQLDASGGLARGNTEYLRADFGARLDATGERTSGFGVVRYALAEADGVVNVSNAFAHVRGNRALAPRLVAEAFAQAERNEQQLLARRYLLGGGLRYEAVETEALGVALGTTPMIEWERLRPDAMEPPSRVARWSSYGSLRVDVSETAEAFSVLYAQPRVDAPADVRVLNESRLDLDLTRRFKVRLRSVVRYDSRPPAGVEPTDLTLTTGFVFNTGGP